MIAEGIILLAIGLLLCFMGVRSFIGQSNAIKKVDNSADNHAMVMRFAKIIGIGTLVVGVSGIVYAILLLVAPKKIYDYLLMAFVVAGIVIVIVGQICLSNRLNSDKN